MTQYLNDQAMEAVVGGAGYPAFDVVAIVGINNPENGTKSILAPEASERGILNAFGKVLANTGGLTNIDVNLVAP